MSDEKLISIPNSKLFGWMIINTIFTVFITSSINFYFQKQNMKDEKLIEYRAEKIKSYSMLITECSTLIEKIDSLISQIRPEDIIVLPNGGRTTTAEGFKRNEEIIDSLNRLGEMGFKLPYQIRIVVFSAKNHFGILFGKKTFPEMYKDKLKTENLSGASFSIALELAKENYIANGEPQHKDLSHVLVE